SKALGATISLNPPKSSLIELKIIAYPSTTMSCCPVSTLLFVILITPFNGVLFDFFVYLRFLIVLQSRKWRSVKVHKWLFTVFNRLITKYTSCLVRRYDPFTMQFCDTLQL